MKIHTLNRRRRLTRLIVMMVFLRSLIATGFMLAVSGIGLEIIVCNGPVSFKPLVSEHHGQKHHHSSDHTENSQLHISPNCSDWSTSSLLMLNSEITISEFKLYVFEKLQFESDLFDASFNSPNHIRAPPLLFLI